MAEFTAAATLDVSVDDSQLRQVRREIERGIGDVEVGVSGGAEAGARTDGGGTGGFAVQTEIMRRTLTAQKASADFDEERNVILEDILDTLQAGVGGGGDGGGGLGVGVGAGGAGVGALGVAGLLAGAPVAATALVLETMRRRQGVERGPIPESARPGIPEGAPGAGVGVGITRRNLLANRVREAQQGGGGRAGDVNVEVIIEQARQGNEEQRIRQVAQTEAQRAAERIKQEFERQVSNPTGLRTLDP